ncbi:MAG: hypothetical protein HC889_00760 [Synechococcaceae cyanobacterium SM1_2_3]|nr:hypothetical protein [Synechococcaceae cyanobacterium SM1_2_3]
MIEVLRNPADGGEGVAILMVGNARAIIRPAFPAGHPCWIVTVDDADTGAALFTRYANRPVNAFRLLMAWNQTGGR